MPTKCTLNWLAALCQEARSLSMCSHEITTRVLHMHTRTCMCGALVDLYAPPPPTPFLVLLLPHQ